MAKDKKDDLSLQDFGKLYLEGNPEFPYESVYVTSDCSVFAGDIKGHNSANNHSKTLKDATVIQVYR